MIGALTANVAEHGTGGLNIDGCRVVTNTPRPARERRLDPTLDKSRNTYGTGINGPRAVEDTTLGRWPANVLHDGSDDPFAGSGTTAAACIREGLRCILTEREPEYVADIKARLDTLIGADLFGDVA